MKGRSHRLPSHDLHDDWIDGSWTVDCVCGVNFDDGEEMVNCDDCGVWVHTRCSRYVKGDELFTCDKCKSKNNKDDSEETEVAQLLVELPTKTIRLESSLVAATGPTCRPVRSWSEIPMEERVHVQGVPGGDPALFTGMPSVFTPQLWKCTGYVPKKFNFSYREFPCWDEKVVSDGRNDDDNENAVDRGAGVLFSLAKDSVLATPATALIGMRGRAAEGRKGYLNERKNWVSEEGEVRHSQIGVKKERSLLHPVVIHSNKRKKEDLGISKVRSGKKKARIPYKEVDAKKRVSHIFKTDRGSKPSVNDVQSGKNKNLRGATIPENDSDCYVSVGNGTENANSSMLVVERSSRTMSIDVSKNDISSGAGFSEEKVIHEGPKLVDSFSKLDNLAASITELNDAGRIRAEPEGDNMPNGYLDKNVEASTGSNGKPRTEELSSSIPEVQEHQVNGDQNKFPSSTENNVKVVANDDEYKGVLNVRSSVSDAKDAGNSHDNPTEISKMNSMASSGSLSGDHKAQEAGRTSETTSDSHANKKNELTSDSLQIKRELEDSEGSNPPQKCSSEPKLGSVFTEDLSKSGVTTSSFSGQNKIVLCVGKSSSTSATCMISKSSTYDHARSPDSLDSNPIARQRECNFITKSDRAASDFIKVKDEDGQYISRKTVKERPKSSENSASKVSNCSKISPASVLKKTDSDLKDSANHSSLRTSSAQNSPETAGLPSNECASHVQNKAPPSGLPVRGEKIIQSNSQLSSKAYHLTSMNPPASTNLSDEELALLLHQELNSSPRVHRVPRRHTGSLPQLSSPNATSMLIKRTSNSGGRDHGLVSRRRHKDLSKDGYSHSHDPDVDAKKTDRVPSSPDRRRQDTADDFSKREDDELQHSVKKNVPGSTSTAKSGPSSAVVIDHHLSSTRDPPRNMSDEETGNVGAPVHRTLPGLINEIMSKGRRMTYEELCNAVLPHWNNLRKHNGERYAYSSPSQAVLDCLRNRHEWAQLVDRGPKTSSSRKRRKLDAEESEENDFGKGRSAKEAEGKSLESQREDVPKGKRKARKRRRLSLQGKGIKEIRKRQKADMLTDDDSGPFSNSSEGSLFSEGEIHCGRGGTVGSDDSASSDEVETS
ncbi:uncharacterized protein LOC126676966 isoform X2 [Mercurialis annua]|uniref:uncharacterized protein LOC126676966 isoform X2 n=1 Tax=Mercurialis annua TaxID=3986 RepID=UPI00215FED08|nr:uncharacterized protein LOC126676966 isoform X2 [Mercurialis annua]